jgi:hypothetical protein
MIRLTQTFGAHTGRVVEHDRDVVRFGRLPDNDVAFDPHADLDASGRHAEIRREGGQWVLIDVGSRNGTLVAGRKVTRHVLTTGDEIEFGLGGPRMRVELGPAAARGAATAQATPIHGGITNHPPAGNSSPPIGPPSPASDMSSPFAAFAPPVAPPSGYPGIPPGPPPPSSVPQMQAMPPSPIPASSPPAGEKKYGQKTVGVMIQAALEQAERQRGGPRSTEAIRAVATEAASKSSRGLKIAVALLTLLVLATAGGLVALFYFGRWKEQELRDENVDLQRQLAQLGEVDEASEAERQRLETRIQELNDQIREESQADGAQIAERNDQAVYILLTRRNDRREVICSAFAVRPDLLATNAHCVGDLERAIEAHQPVEIVSNRGRGTNLSVRQMWRHPNYVADAPIPTPDVGLIRVDRTVPTVATLADMQQLSALRAGDDVFVFGFPSVIAPTGAPVAGITTGVVGRMTAFDGTEVEASRRHLVSHSALADDGTAGSPLFDREGHVVAINAGNYRTRSRVVDPGTRLSRTVDTETPYAWAVRADLLLQLLAGLPQQ